jgi:hypothetical protein
MATKRGAPKPKKPKKPARVKARQVRIRTPQADLIKQANEMVAAQAQSPVGAQLTAEITDVKTAVTAVTTAGTAETNAAAALATAKDNVVSAEDNLIDKMNAYSTKAIKVTGGNLDLLKTTAVQAVSGQHGPRDNGPAGVVTGVGVGAGPESGQAQIHWKRPHGAAAFIAQYMLEPASPPPAGAPPPQWLPSEGYHTKKVEWLITGLPPAAAIRVRIRAIGAEIGAWSDDVIGKAR